MTVVPYISGVWVAQMSAICAIIDVVTAALQTLLDKLGRELEPLLESGDNWQIAVHGGRGGDVMVEVKRTCQVIPPASQKARTCAQHS